MGRDFTETLELQSVLARIVKINLKSYYLIQQELKMKLKSWLGILIMFAHFKFQIII